MLTGDTMVWNKGLTKETSEAVRRMCKSKMRQVKCICKQCGEEYSVIKSRVDRTNYCSRGCYNAFIKEHGIQNSEITRYQKGHTLRRGKGFYLDKSTGYMMRVLNNKKIYQHHYIWNRESDWHFIPKGFVVHHINGDKLDNRFENLVCIPRDVHGSLHDELRKIEGDDKIGC